MTDIDKINAHIEKQDFLDNLKLEPIIIGNSNQGNEGLVKIIKGKLEVLNNILRDKDLEIEILKETVKLEEIKVSNLAIEATRLRANKPQAPIKKLHEEIKRLTEENKSLKKYSKENRVSDIKCHAGLPEGYNKKFAAYNVDIQIVDRNIVHPFREIEIEVGYNETLVDATNRILKKNRYSMDLSTKFNFSIYNAVCTGYVSY